MGSKKKRAAPGQPNQEKTVNDYFPTIAGNACRGKKLNWRPIWPERTASGQGGERPRFAWIRSQMLRIDENR